MGHLHVCIHMAITHTVSQHMHAPKSGVIMPGATTQPVWHLAQEGTYYIHMHDRGTCENHSRGGDAVARARR